ncbi:MAG: PAN domain-containing protein [Hyphomonadaceae bacterium]|nr:PAN domain-containing protein [Hyphomonadaceae bacterium]
MRLLKVFAVSALACALAAHATAQIGPAGDANVARPGGVYNLLTTDNPNACAQACAVDGICMAWTYLPGGVCELKAVTPAPIRSVGARSGLSVRTPAPLRAADAASLRSLTPVVSAPAPSPEQPALTWAAATDDSGLLGGPEPQSPEPLLRTRLSAAATQ